MKKAIALLLLLTLSLPAMAQEAPMGRYVESAEQLPVKLDNAYDFFLDAQGRLSFFAQAGGKILRLFLDEELDAGILNEAVPLSIMMNGACTTDLWERILKDKEKRP